MTGIDRYHIDLTGLTDQQYKHWQRYQEIVNEYESHTLISDLAACAKTYWLVPIIYTTLYCVLPASPLWMVIRIYIILSLGAGIVFGSWKAVGITYLLLLWTTYCLISEYLPTACGQMCV